MTMKKKAYMLTLISSILLILLNTLILLHKIPENLKVLAFILISLSCGAFGHGIGILLEIKQRKDNPDLQKIIDIEVNDERNQKLQMISKAKGFDFMLYLVAALLLTYALLNVDIIVIMLLLAVYLIVLFYVVYIRSKLEKEI